MVAKQIKLTQWDVVWLDLPEPVGPAPGGRHPAVVIQGDRFNTTRLDTVIVAMITSQLHIANHPGNVLLTLGEAGLTKLSVVNITQIFTADRNDVIKKTGRLTKGHQEAVWAGIMMALTP